MDIKNVIIAALVVMLGISTLEATNMIDLIPNRDYHYLSPKSSLEPKEGEEIENTAQVLQSIDVFHNKFNTCFGADANGKPISEFNPNTKGVYISFAAIANVLKSNPVLSNNLTPDGIVCYPFVDNKGLNMYVSVANATFDRTAVDPDFEPFPGSDELTKKPKGVKGNGTYCPQVCGL